MKDTIKAKVGYTVKNNYHDKRTGEKVWVLFDGDEMIMAAHIMSLEDHIENMKGNECYHICEEFHTVKGNKFIYSRDEEIDEDYLIKIETNNNK